MKGFDQETLNKLVDMKDSKPTPRYVIEMDEPKTCRDCPMIWEDRTEGLEPSECQLADEWLPPLYEENKPPSWCPLQPLDDASLE